MSQHTTNAAQSRQAPSAASLTSSIPILLDDNIRAQLAAILSSHDFIVPARLSQFLSYVVEEALAGRGKRIKATSIAVDVFGRGANFDIMGDPVVRIEAGRLRRALERYYLLEGRDAPILIDIPKGGYAPCFTAQQREAQPEGAAPTSRAADSGREPKRPVQLRVAAAISVMGLVLGGISISVVSSSPAFEAGPARFATTPIAVKPFAMLSASDSSQVFALGLSEEIVAQLAPIANLTVFWSGSTGDRMTVSTASRRPGQGVPYVLEGAVRTADGKHRITARLLDGDTGAIVWSAVFDIGHSAHGTFAAEEGLAAKIAVAAASAALAQSEARAMR